MFTFIVYLASLLITSALSAKSKVCSPYPYISLDNGNIHRIGYQKYSFKCNEGFFLASSATVRCLRGNWTSTKEPKCLKIRGQCDEPPPVENALIFGDDRHEGATVRYICNEGFTLLGHSELTCLRNGYWNKLAPTCMDESEPLQHVAERLKNSFVTELSFHSSGTPEGRSLDKTSLLLGLELFLLIDRSSSIDPVDLEEAKDFVKFLLKRFGVNNKVSNKNGTRAAVLAFGTEVQIVFGIDHTNISNAKIAAAAVDEIQPNGGGTNMEGALTKVLLDSFQLRPAAKKALFMMTDGEPNIANPEITPQDIASQLRKSPHNFEIFTLGIGKGIRMSLLNELASEPPQNHVFMLENYPDIKELMKKIENSPPPSQPIGKNQCGYNATGEDRPWLATLYIGGGPFKICSGVLICKQWVLTAASCLEDDHKLIDMKDVFVVLGERRLSKNEKDKTNFYVTEMQSHKNFRPKDSIIENNLAILKLDSPADFKYRPACLPPTDRAIPLHLNLKINASVAGWGLTTASKMTYATAKDLKFEMSSSSVSLSEERECPSRRKVANPLCAGQGSNTCYALVGSPLMAEDPLTGFHHVLGILADRRHCSKGQNQYVELTKHIGWINHDTSNCHLEHWGLAG